MEKFKRDAYKLVKVGLSNNQTPILFGLRRIGKTTILMQLEKEVKNSVYIDWSEFKYKNLSEMEFYDVLEEHCAKYDLVLCDEVQTFKNWDHMLFNLYNKFVFKGLCKIVATGSSSLLMQPKELGLNRSKRIYMNSLSFKEYLRFTGKKKTIETFEYYLGRGFPDFVDYDFEKNGFEEAFIDVLEPIFKEDIYIEHRKADIDKMLNLVDYLGTTASGEINESSIAKTLKITRDTVRSYIDIFQRSNILKKVYKVNPDGNQSRKKRYKIYLNPHFYIWINRMSFKQIKKYKNDFVGHIIEAFWIHEKTTSENNMNKYYYLADNDQNIEIDFVSLHGKKNVFKDLHELKYKDKIKFSYYQPMLSIKADSKTIWYKEKENKEIVVNQISILDI